MHRFRWPLALLGLVMFLLFGRGLVTGPEEERTPVQQAPSYPCYAVQLPLSGEQELPGSSQSGQTGKESAAVFTQSASCCVSCTCDRNGMPLTSRTWRKTVYLVCPPEGVPG